MKKLLLLMIAITSVQAFSAEVGDQIIFDRLNEQSILFEETYEFYVNEDESEYVRYSQGTHSMLKCKITRKTDAKNTENIITDRDVFNIERIFRHSDHHTYRSGYLLTRTVGEQKEYYSLKCYFPIPGLDGKTYYHSGFFADKLDIVLSEKLTFITN